MSVCMYGLSSHLFQFQVMLNCVHVCFHLWKIHLWKIVGFCLVQVTPGPVCFRKDNMYRSECSARVAPYRI